MMKVKGVSVAAAVEEDHHALGGLRQGRANRDSGSMRASGQRERAARNAVLTRRAPSASSLPTAAAAGQPPRELL